MVLPDPFTPNLKIDLLTEIQQAPVVLSNVVGPIEGMRMDLDAFLNDPQRSDFLSTLLPRLCKDGTNEVDAARVKLSGAVRWNQGHCEDPERSDGASSPTHAGDGDFLRSSWSLTTAVATPA
jgi:hypothetical protein